MGNEVCDAEALANANGRCSLPIEPHGTWQQAMTNFQGPGSSPEILMHFLVVLGKDTTHFLPLLVLERNTRYISAQELVLVCA